MIGSIRRECLDHLIVIDERHLRRRLASYFDYYHRSRTHLSLGNRSWSCRSSGRRRQSGGLDGTRPLQAPPSPRLHRDWMPSP
ncbi:MAG: hypothetical protein O7G13_10485 [Alphaproteobacteria bacterium]|nr:hypothetical protein [Alphaproteobacteria bacterium]